MTGESLETAIKDMFKEGIRVVKGFTLPRKEECLKEACIVKAKELLDLLDSMQEEIAGKMPSECVLIIEPPNREELKELIEWREK